MKRVQPCLDFSDTSIWSICSAEKPIAEKDGGGFHAMLMLIQQNADGVAIADELHFKPDGHKSGGGKISANSGIDAALSGVELLVASAYTNPDRKIEDLAFQYIYTSGSPRHMLSLWNEALRAAAAIKDLKRPYGDNANCRAGIKGVVESIGFRFETLDHPRTRRGLHVNFAAEIDFDFTLAENENIETARTEWQAAHGLRRCLKPALHARAAKSLQL